MSSVYFCIESWLEINPPVDILPLWKIMKFSEITQARIFFLMTVFYFT
jgi:hypothetical protein